MKAVPRNLHIVLPASKLSLGPFQHQVAGGEAQGQKVPSIARVAAGAFGFLTLIQVFDGPERYGAFSFFETIPSRPCLQTASTQSIAHEVIPLLIAQNPSPGAKRTRLMLAPERRKAPMQ
jgi:hypothetical protein